MLYFQIIKPFGNYAHPSNFKLLDEETTQLDQSILFTIFAISTFKN